MSRWDAVPWELRYPGLKRPEPKPDPVARVRRALDQIGAAMQEQEQHDRRRANRQRLERLVTAVERANARLDARQAVQERSQGRHGPDLARALDKGLPLDERRHALADAFGHPHRHLPGQTPHRHTGSEHR